MKVIARNPSGDILWQVEGKSAEEIGGLIQMDLEHSEDGGRRRIIIDPDKAGEMPESEK